MTRVYAIVPARSGSKGLKDKNISKIGGYPLIGHAIKCGLSIQGVDRVLCSTDSEKYADIAKSYGADVPFLRSSSASSDFAMEHHILNDLHESMSRVAMPLPDIIVWLRPTFIFRDVQLLDDGVMQLSNSPNLDSVRIVIDAESRLYRQGKSGQLVADFDDQGKSMIRRQDLGQRFRVYSTDIFRFGSYPYKPDFLGQNVGYIEGSKLCGLDIDDHHDFLIAKAVYEARFDEFEKYSAKFKS